MFSGGRDKQQRAVGLKLIFSYNVFYCAYESCILVGESQSKIRLWCHSVNLFNYRGVSESKIFKIHRFKIFL